MSLTYKRKSKGLRTEPWGPQSWPVVTQEWSHIDLYVYCRSHPRSNLYKLSSLKSGMRENPVRKIRPVVNKIRNFVLLRSIIIKKHLLQNTENQKTKARNSKSTTKHGVRVPLRWSGSGSMIRDHWNHGRSNEPMNLLWTRIIYYIVCPKCKNSCSSINVINS